MPFNEGFNFRQSSGYVTDPADTQFVSAGTSYPTTANGVTFGWVNQVFGNDRNRSTTSDHRLSGVNFVPNNSSQDIYFRVDLPATGDYEIRAAFGDISVTSVVNHYAQFRDDVTAFATLDHNGETLLGPAFWDATNVKRTSEADWVSNNAALTHTFTSTTFICALGQPGTSVTGNSHIAHLQIAAAAGGTTFNQALQASCSPVALLARQIGKPLAAATTPPATLARATWKPLAASSSPVGTLTRQTGKPLAGASSPLAALTRATGKPLQASALPVASLGAIRVVLLALQATAAATASLARSVGKRVQAAMSPTGTLRRDVAKTLQAATSPAASVAKAIGKALQAAASAVARLLESLNPTAPPSFIRVTSSEAVAWTIASSEAAAWTIAASDAPLWSITPSELGS